MGITLNMLPDLFASATLITLAIYHLMIYWGRKKDEGEIYNLYFALFVFTATLFILAPYLQPQYFLYPLKPSWLYVINIEALMSWCLFYSGIKFLNLLLLVPPVLKKYFKITFISMPFNVLLTLTANFISTGFYFKNIMPVVLAVVAINVILVYSIYGVWMYREKLYRENFYTILYVGFILLTSNILVYRSIELFTIPNILVFNHYASAIILYIFAYALSVKFNNEYFELKILKIGLEQKVRERTEALEQSNQLLGKQNAEIEMQRQAIGDINKELEARALELSELNQARSRFFTGISHEFRTPLTLIIGPLETLLSHANDNTKTKGDYELMLRQAKRLLALINQLLELSKLQRGVQTLDLAKSDFNAFIHATISSYDLLAAELGIELSFIEESVETNAVFDKDKMEKIVTNLVTNALKFTPAGGKVDVVLGRSADQQFIELSVHDTGIGISPEEVEYIFEPFYQADPSRNHRLHGTGIGLSLLKELVELHRGTIRVKSSIHKGTAFTISIPAGLESYHPHEAWPEQLAEEAISEGDIDNGNAHRTSSQKHVILIVEDNLDMRNYIRSCLPSTYLVHEAPNGKVGFDVAVKLMPDLVITDVLMPVCDGLEMTRNIKQDENISHLPVIMLTAKASTESKLEGLGAHADDYLTKPFNADELVLRIENLLASRERLREKFERCITVNPSELTTTSIDEQFLRKVLKVTEENIAETEFDTVQFCDSIGMSRAQVHRKLKALTGLSATHFIRSIRLKRAAQLLSQNAATVSEVAYMTGFNNLSFFTRCFKEQFNTVPSAYVAEEEKN